MLVKICYYRIIASGKVMMTEYQLILNMLKPLR